ncbi:putative transcription elongation factor SPT5 homolog 1 isoform X2 [Rutidosis leptorrhynchoides]|uniref:putative transcription elongation factor SPT5 homolog 1 isoform X2 n=1 Tax=Rutidosis leptorrhynchoides TaxID=125765 RepID=UPI003A99D497
MAGGRYDYDDDVAEEYDDAIGEDYDSRRGGDERKRRRSDFIDDVAAEEYEDEEYDEDYGGSRRRGGKAVKKASGASDFFELEADVDADADEDEEEDGEDDFIVNERDDVDDEEGGRRMHRRPLLSREDDQEDVEALERIIQERFGRNHIEEEDDDDYDDDDQTQVEQQALLPSVRDPKLWMVKCAIGHEREVAACLMQKCIDMGPELQIRSAIALDHLKSYIYIEADKESHVKQACKGMRNIYTGSKILLVPIKEMTDVLSVESKAIDISRDTWVRMKIGIYKGDLAKVVDVDNIRQRVTVKLIPRINLQALANKLVGRQDEKKKTFTPPPRFMNLDEAREMNVRVERGRDPVTGDYYDKINGMMFKDGFLYKTVSLKSIITQDIQPSSFDEVEKFQRKLPNNENGDGGEIASLSRLFENSRMKKGSFVKGDVVIVTKGDLKTIKGRVAKVEQGIVHIKPNTTTDLPETLAVSEREVCKYFEPGNHVKVVSGAQEGATGMVVSVDRQFVNIVSDITKEVMRVFSNNVVETSQVTSVITKIGDRNVNPLQSRVAQRRTPTSLLGTSPCPPLIGGGRAKKDCLVGRNIKIRLGPYKGYKGRVVKVNGTSIRVELESQMKIVAVDRSQISDILNKSSTTVPYRESHMHPLRTPLHPFMTPMRDLGATPIHSGMRTPIRDTAWIPSPPRPDSICI